MSLNISIKSVLLVLGLCFCMVLLCGCIENQSREPAMRVGQSEVLTITGSTTVLPVIAQAAEIFMDKNPDIEVLVTGGGSGVGVMSAGEGTAMVGMASRDIKREENEKYPGLVEHRIAIDGMVIITHITNPVPSLTLAQIKAIYNGTIRNWKEVGGKDGVIVVTGRDSASGTREFFHVEIMNREDFLQNQLEKNSNGAVWQSVRQTPSAIGYVSLGYIDDDVYAVPILVEGKEIKPSIETVKNGLYPVARPLNLITNGEPAGITSDFISFLSTPEIEQIIIGEGFIPITR
ncbi:MAG: phosphate ABC transporter substrate-binding protein [Methanomicrobiales archaeon]|nr:phosphate ABC transporter substrate-binding protein [Methanomicrobiales archaeon]